MVESHTVVKASEDRDTTVSSKKDDTSSPNAFFTSSHNLFSAFKVFKY